MCTAISTTPELLRIPFYIYESSLPQFMERPLHAGAGTVTQRRHGSNVHHTGIPATVAEFQVARVRELDRHQAIMKQDRIHFNNLLAMAIPKSSFKQIGLVLLLFYADAQANDLPSHGTELWQRVVPYE